MLSTSNHCFNSILHFSPRYLTLGNHFSIFIQKFTDYRSIFIFLLRKIEFYTFYLLLAHKSCPHLFVLSYEVYKTSHDIILPSLPCACSQGSSKEFTLLMIRAHGVWPLM